MAKCLSAAAWNRFFFSSIPAYPLALFRIAFALIVTVMLLLLIPDAFVWFGEEGALPKQVASRLLDGPRLSLFQVLPTSDYTVIGVLACSVATALLLAVGFQT